MKLATVLSPVNSTNLQLAAACGVTDLVGRYYGRDSQQLHALQHQAEEFGLHVSVIEGYLPIERLKLGIDDGTDLEAMRLLIRQMGDAGVGLLCYNFMSGTDWVRTRIDVPARGRTTVTEFRLEAIARAQSLNAPRTTGPLVTADQLWNNLERFLHELLPTAEQSGVTLAMHPDDPPLPVLLGQARIMNSVENFERMLALAPSPANAICFCQGTFSEMGVDIPATIRRLGSHIRYVHCRDTAGTADSFVETFHDNGPTDMFAAMQAYRAIGFSGPLRPDHVPVFAGEEGDPGYTMLGRLFAYGYLRGLMQASETPGGSFFSTTD